MRHDLPIQIYFWRDRHLTLCRHDRPLEFTQQVCHMSCPAEGLNIYNIYSASLLTLTHSEYVRPGYNLCFYGLGAFNYSNYGKMLQPLMASLPNHYSAWLPLRACSISIQPGAFVHLKSGKIHHFVFTPNLLWQEWPKFEFISGVTAKFACRQNLNLFPARPPFGLIARQARLLNL